MPHGVAAMRSFVDTIHRAARFPAEAWRSDLETNLTGAFVLAQALVDFHDSQHIGLARWCELFIIAPACPYTPRFQNGITCSV